MKAQAPIEAERRGVIFGDAKRQVLMVRAGRDRHRPSHKGPGQFAPAMGTRGEQLNDERTGGRILPRPLPDDLDRRHELLPLGDSDQGCHRPQLAIGTGERGLNIGHGFRQVRAGNAGIIGLEVQFAKVQNVP